MKRFVISLFFSLLLIDVYGNDCNCDFTLTKDEWKYDGEEMGVFPGAIICIESGNRRQLHLSNFKGSPDKPLTFINCNGKVTISGKGTYGFKTRACQYFRVTGTGSKGIEYGIEIKDRNQGMQLEYGSSDFELDHLEIHHIGFAGIMAKTDPTCDPATWRENFTMRNVSIHHNYIHHTDRGEALYIGNSFYENGRDLECGDKFPHAILGLKVYKNIVHDTGSDGIQVGCAIEGCEIYDNLVERTGVNPFMNYQSNGIQVGEGTGGLCYNNIVLNPGANGIVVLGTGDNIIFNNLIVNPGTNGFFCDERYTTGEGFNFFHNTIINPKQDGFRMYAQEVKQNQIMNNIVVNPGAYDSYNADKTWRTGENSAYIHRLNPNMNNLMVSNNIFTRNINDVKFINNKSNFRLTSSSPAINAGKNLTRYDITFDLDYLKRSDNQFDIGAYEFDGVANIPPLVDAGPDTTILASQNFFTLKGVVSDTDGKITHIEWEQVSGPGTASLQSIGNSNLKVTDFIEGEYVFNLTAIDDSKAISTDQVKVTIIKVILPVINLGIDTSFVNPIEELKLFPKELTSTSDIINYNWQQLSGPEETGWIADKDTLLLSQPIDGIYEFILEVTNADNATNSDTIKIFIYPEKPEIILNGQLVFCKNDSSLLLSGPSGEYEYFWSNGSSEPEIEVISSGKYYLHIENGYGLKSLTSDTLEVAVKDNPEKPVVAFSGETVLCSNDTLVLKGPIGFDKYYWSNDSTGSEVKITDPGYYSLVVESNGCKSELSDSVKILNDVITETPLISYEGSLELCETETKLLIGPEGYRHYQWNTGETKSSITIDSTGYFSLQVANCIESWSESSDSIFLKFNPLPEKPLLKHEGDLNICEGDSVKFLAPDNFKSYKWESYNSNKDIIQVKESGYYRVSVQSTESCWSEYSDSLEVVVTAIPEKPELLTENNVNEICPNDSILIYGPEGFQEYIWNSDTTTNSSVFVIQAGEYSLMIGNNGCYSKSSEPIEVKNIDTDKKPEITYSGPTDLCIGESLELSTAYSYNYSWSTGDSTQMITTDSSGLYAIQVSYCPGIWSESSDTLHLTFHENPQKPIVEVMGETSFCDGDSAILSVSSEFKAYNWLNINDSSNQIIVKNSGDYQVSVQSQYNCWSEYSDIVTTINKPIPVKPSILVNGETKICSSDSVELTVEGGFDTYLWSTGASNSSIFAKNASSYDVKVNNNGCWSEESDSIIIEFFQIPEEPTIDYAGGSNFCINENTLLEAPEGFTFYKWNNAKSSRIIEVNQTDSYSVQVANCPGEWSKPSEIIDLTFHDLPEVPSISINGKLNFCEGENVELSAPENYVSYQWKGIFTESRSITIAESGTFQVRVRSEFDCWSLYSEPVTVNQIELPEEPEISVAGKTILCDDETVKLTANGGYDGYLWSNGFTQQSIEINESGTFSVKVNRKGCWSYFSESKAIRHNPIPEKPQIANNGKSNLCIGETLDINVPPGYNYYLWSDGSTSNKVTVTENSTYQIQVAYCKNRWSVTSDPLIFQYHEVATPNIRVEGNTSFCEGESVLLQGPSDVKQYQWNSQNPGENANLEVKQSGKYQLRVSNVYDCWSNYSAEVHLQMINKTAKTEIINKSSLTFCQGSSVILESTKNFDEYLWSNGSKEKSININNSGSYNLKVKDNGLCFSDASNLLTVNVLDIPEKPALIAPDINSICEGETITLSTPANYNSYFWSNGATSQSINTNISGSYAVRVKNQNNCWSQFSDKFDLNVIKTPRNPTALIEEGDNELCEGEEATLTVKNQYSFYKWSTGSESNNIYVSESGVYTVQVSNCPGTWSAPSFPIEIIVHELPEKPEISIVEDRLFVNSIDQYGYQWYLNSFPILNALSNVYPPVFEGSYQVEIITPNGCSILSDPFAYDVEDKEVIIYPNPTNGKFRIVLVDQTINSGKVSILNADHRIISEKYFTNIDNYYIPDLFDLSNYNKGVYIIKIETRNNVINKKLILK